MVESKEPESSSIDILLGARPSETTDGLDSTSPHATSEHQSAATPPALTADVLEEVQKAQPEDLTPVQGLDLPIAKIQQPDMRQIPFVPLMTEEEEEPVFFGISSPTAGTSVPATSTTFLSPGMLPPTFTAPSAPSMTIPPPIPMHLSPGFTAMHLYMDEKRWLAALLCVVTEEVRRSPCKIAVVVYSDPVATVLRKLFMSIGTFNQVSLSAMIRSANSPQLTFSKPQKAAKCGVIVQVGVNRSQREWRLCEDPVDSR